MYFFCLSASTGYFVRMLLDLSFILGRRKKICLGLLDGPWSTFFVLFFIFSLDPKLVPDVFYRVALREKGSVIRLIFLPIGFFLYRLNNFVANNFVRWDSRELFFRTSWGISGSCRINGDTGTRWVAGEARATTSTCLRGKSGETRKRERERSPGCSNSLLVDSSSWVCKFRFLSGCKKFLYVKTYI